MALAIFLTLVFLYSLISKRLESTAITGPIVFTSIGMLLGLGHDLVHLAGLSLNTHMLLTLAEVGLVLLLFTDASRTKLTVLKRIEKLPARLLSIGMLLTILLGAIAARLVFPQLTIWEAGILAAILAPTDAGLGQVIVNSKRVPPRVREALNVEAGLNDGLSVPFLLFFIALAAAPIEGERASLVQFIVEQLGYGILVGLAIGLIGGWCLHFAKSRDWMAESFQQISVVAIPLLCIIASEEVGASMFIAAFVAGLAIQSRFKKVGKHSVEFAEEWGQLINLLVFFLFGIICANSIPEFTLATVFYAVLSLTVVRMLPVAISLIGTKLDTASVVFMGWFGPRGLASIVLGLVYLEQEEALVGEDTIRLAIMATVMLSIFAHGLSGQFGIGLYASKTANTDPPKKTTG